MCSVFCPSFANSNILHRWLLAVFLVNNTVLPYHSMTSKMRNWIRHGRERTDKAEQVPTIPHGFDMNISFVSYLWAIFSNNSTLQFPYEPLVFVSIAETSEHSISDTMIGSSQQ